MNIELIALLGGSGAAFDGLIVRSADKAQAWVAPVGTPIPEGKVDDDSALYEAGWKHVGEVRNLTVVTSPALVDARIDALRSGRVS